MEDLFSEEFDLDKVSGRFTSDKQSFGRIRDVRAVKGAVMIIADGREPDPETEAGHALHTQCWSIQQAAQHARGLNRMIHMIPEADRETAFEIVQATVDAIKEAKQQQEEDPQAAEFAASLHKLGRALVEEHQMQAISEGNWGALQKMLAEETDRRQAAREGKLPKQSRPRPR